MKRESKTALLIDIGSGTRDILLFQTGKTLENSVKIVAPTATLKFSREIKKENRDIKIAGYTMGGGPLSNALSDHLKKGFKIHIEPQAAFTVRNNLKELVESGFEIHEHITSPDYFFDEIELSKIERTLSDFGMDSLEYSLIGLSVQDHGNHEPEQSSREKRFDCFLELLKEKRDLRSLIFTDKDTPEFFSRMQSGIACIQKTRPDVPMIIMDTCISAITGCWFDENIRNEAGPMLYLNFGNGHTLAAIVENTEILAIYEHHTGLIKNRIEVLENHLLKLISGNLKQREVFEDGGHGCQTFRSIDFAQITRIVITGPNRYLGKKLSFEKSYEASPAGDMMMTGPLGLLRGYELKHGQAL
ncbi:MAG: DUF1786 domain-containing protein [Candidatus Rifleibacteriota bacterium]